MGVKYVGELPLAQHYFEQCAVLSGLYRHGGLIGVDLKEHFALLYRLAHLPVPLDQLALVHIKAQLGHNNNFCHVPFSLQQDLHRMLQQVLHVLHKLGGQQTVDEPVVHRKLDVHHGADCNYILAIFIGNHHRRLAHRADRQGSPPRGR